MAVTVDHISGGRADPRPRRGLAEIEHAAYGFPFGSGFGERLDWMDEAVGAIRRLLDGEKVTSEPGGTYRFDGLRLNPPPAPATPADHDRRHRREEDAALRRALRGHVERQGPAEIQRRRTACSARTATPSGATPPRSSAR